MMFDIAPHLDIKQDRGFGDDGGLLGLLLMVRLQPLLSDPLLLLGLLLVTATCQCQRSKLNPMKLCLPRRKIHQYVHVRFVKKEEGVSEEMLYRM